MTHKSEIILITGSSQGLGFEIAKICSQKLKRILLTGRSNNKLQLALEMLDHSSNHGVFCGDLTDQGYLDELLNHLSDEALCPNVIIHCLGGKVEGDEQPLSASVLRSSLRSLEVSVAINAHFLPKMVRKKSGRIIHIGSDASLTGNCAPGYAAAKAALNAYVKSSARFYVRHDVMICAVLPGIFEHEGSAWAKKKIGQPEIYQKRCEEMPLGRFAHPSEVASVVADVACSESLMYAGSLLQVTGGY